MSDLLGVAISEGALVNILADSRSAFACQAERIQERLRSSTILQSDETSVRVGKRTWWTWVFHHDRDCCLAIRPSRGRDVVADFLGEHRPDIWVSDRFAAQMGWATRAHQVCLAHLIRDAQRAIEAGDAAFAPGLKKLLQRACGMGHAARIWPTRRCAATPASSTPGSMICCGVPRPMRSARSCNARSRPAGRTCSCSSPTGPCRPPTTAPSRACARA